MLSIIHSYFVWHYTNGFGELIYISKNFIFAEYKLFSLKEMLITIFYPWKKLDAQYPKIIDLGEFIGTIIVNGLMRTIGFLIKTTFIILGIVSILLTILISIISIFVWTVMPIFIATLFIYGLSKI
jgi:hypothetical protein